jgi:glycosyltransferase involved in cell wall biosynthesis
MKILHVYKDYFPPVVGGVEKHIAELCNHFKHKYDVEVLVCNRGPFTRIEDIDGVKVTKVGQLGRIQSAPVAPSFPLWLRKIKADIFHYHMPNPTCEFSHLLARPPGALVATYHSDIIRQESLLKLYGPSLRKFLNRADVIMPTSAVYADQSPFLRDFKSKCEIVPLGIDTQKFGDASSRLKSEIEKLRGVFGPEFILFVGKLRYYKGLQFLIQAMPKIQAPLVIIGTGPMESDLKMIAANYGVSEKAQFLGEVSEDDLSAFYHACSLLVLPSIFKSEAYGLVQLEAHACGKPVVSTRLGTGVEFVNMDGKTGLIVPPADSKALADAINQLLSDPERIQRMGEFARQRAQNEFDFAQMFAKIDAVYKRVIAAES